MFFVLVFIVLISSFAASQVSTSLSSPRGVAVDTQGNIYVADSGNNVIRKIFPAGDWTILAGSGTWSNQNGQGTAASFAYPYSVAVNASGHLVVGELWDRVRIVSPSGHVSTLAGSSTGFSDGTGSAASFNTVASVAFDPLGNIFVADRDNNRIRRVTAQGVVSTIAGNAQTGSLDGQGVNATFSRPSGVAVDSSGNVYVADTENHKIRRITPSGLVTTFAGTGAAGSRDGNSTTATFFSPTGIAIDSFGNLYVGDSYNNKIRKITPQGIVSTFAGSGLLGTQDGDGSSASFNYPYGVAVDSLGNVFVADTYNNRIRRITPSGSVTTILNSANTIVSPSQTVVRPTFSMTSTMLNFANHVPSPSPAVVRPTVSITSTILPIVTSTLNSPKGVTVDTQGNIYVADTGNHVIRKISRSGELSILAGNGILGTRDGQGTAASFSHPYSITVNTSGHLVVGEFMDRVRIVSPSGYVSTLAGSSTGFRDGTGSEALFNTVASVAFDSLGNIFVADRDNNRIRRVTPQGVVSTIAGNAQEGSLDGQGVNATFYRPRGVAVDSSGNVYVADTYNHKIRLITPSGLVTTLAGTGAVGSRDGNSTTATFYFPMGIAIDVFGNLYIADYGNHKIRKITPQGIVSTLAGRGLIGTLDGDGASASFNYPEGVAVDAFGNVFVADTYNNRIRRITPSGSVTTIMNIANNNVSPSPTPASLISPSLTPQPGDGFVISTITIIIIAACAGFLAVVLAGVFLYRYRASTRGFITATHGTPGADSWQHPAPSAIAYRIA